MKVNFLFLIFECLIQIKAFIEERMLITTIEDFSKFYQIGFYIGSANRSKTLRINQEKDYMSFYYMLYSPYLSKSVNVIERTNEFEAYDDTIVLSHHIPNAPNVSLTKFPFKILSDSEARLLNDLRGGIGLPYKYSNESYSLIHQLRQNDVIDHLSYSLIPNSISEPGQIAFGGLPRHLIDKKQRGICKIDQSQSKWSCKLSQVLIGNNAYDNNNQSFFQVGERYIIAPIEFTNLLLSTIFGKVIESHQCFVAKEDIIYCEREVANLMPSISFIFDRTVYTLDPVDLFETTEDYNRFIITSNKASNDSWIFGTKFLIHFPSLFDYENSVIEFYSETKIHDEDSFKRSRSVEKISANRYTQLCVVLTLIILLIGIMTLLYSKYNKAI